MDENENISIDTTSELTIEDQIADLRYLLNSEQAKFDKHTKEFLKRNGKKEQIPKDELCLHVEHGKFIRQIERSYNLMLKMNKSINGSPYNTGKMVDMSAIKSEHSSINGIIQKIPNSKII